MGSVSLYMNSSKMGLVPISPKMSLRDDLEGWLNFLPGFLVFKLDLVGKSTTVNASVSN